MFLRLFLAFLVLLLSWWLAGPAMTVGLMILFLIGAHARWMLWSAARRNEAERREVELVNAGRRAPSPETLARIWRGQLD